MLAFASLQLCSLLLRKGFLKSDIFFLHFLKFEKILTGGCEGRRGVGGDHHTGIYWLFCVDHPPTYIPAVNPVFLIPVNIPVF